MVQSAVGVAQAEREKEREAQPRGRIHGGNRTASFLPGGDALGVGHRKQSADSRKPLRRNDGHGVLQGGEKLERSDAGAVKIVLVANGRNTA